MSSPTPPPFRQAEPNVFGDDDALASVSAAYFRERPIGGKIGRRKPRRYTPLLWFFGPLLGLWSVGRLPQHFALAVCGLALLGLGVFLAWRRVRIFGPVCVRDLVGTSRRARFVVLRTVYLLCLLGTLAAVYSGFFHDDTAIPGGGGWFEGTARLHYREMAVFAERFFWQFLLVQLLAVVVLTPVYLASALPEEKERGTLELLFSTPLEDQEILAGKMIGRLGQVMFLLLAGLPFLAMLQFFGGVEPAFVFAGFAFTASTALSVACLSMWCGLHFRRTIEAIFWTYAWLVLFVVGSFSLYAAIYLWNSLCHVLEVVWTLPDWTHLNYTHFGNPFLAALDVLRALGVGGRAVLDVVGDYVFFHLVLSAGLVALTLRYCRSAVLALAEPKSLWRRSGVEFPPRLRRPPLGGWPPLLWKEIHADAPVGSHRFSALVMFLSLVFGWVLVAVLVVMLLLLLGVSYDSVLEHGLSQIHQAVRGMGCLLGGFMLFLVPLYAAGSVIRERERQTLDGLLTLPDGPGAILFAKWIGATQAVRPLWPCLLIIWGVGVVTGTLHVLAVPLLVLAWAIYALFFSALGLWFSITQKTSVRAMLWALSCLFALVYARNLLLTAAPAYSGEGEQFGLHPLLAGVLPSWSLPGLIEWLRFGLLPWDGLAALSFDYRAVELPMRMWGAFVGLAVYAVGAATLWALCRWRFLRQTMRN